VLALAMPLVLLPTGLLHRILKQPGLGRFDQEFIFWGLTALVLLVLVFGEGLGLSAIGLRRPRWSSLGWGMVGFVAVLTTTAFFNFVVIRALGGAMTGIAVVKFASTLTVPMIFILALRAAVTEEILFRGYGIERLTALTGSPAIGALVPWFVFTICHLNAWGFTYLIAIAPVGAVLTGLYLWRRDLNANIVTHFLTDAFSMSVGYAVSHHLVTM
jgi:uncharacterized protein